MDNQSVAPYHSTSSGSSGSWISRGQSSGPLPSNMLPLGTEHLAEVPTSSTDMAQQMMPVDWPHASPTDLTSTGEGQQAHEAWLLPLEQPPADNSCLSPATTAAVTAAGSFPHQMSRSAAWLAQDSAAALQPALHVSTWQHHISIARLPQASILQTGDLQAVEGIQAQVSEIIDPPVSGPAMTLHAPGQMAEVPVNLQCPSQDWSALFADKSEAVMATSNGSTSCLPSGTTARAEDVLPHAMAAANPCPASWYPAGSLSHLEDMARQAQIFIGDRPHTKQVPMLLSGAARDAPPAEPAEATATRTTRSASAATSLTPHSHSVRGSITALRDAKNSATAAAAAATKAVGAPLLSRDSPRRSKLCSDDKLHRLEPPAVLLTQRSQDPTPALTGFDSPQHMQRMRAIVAGDARLLASVQQMQALGSGVMPAELASPGTSQAPAMDSLLPHLQAFAAHMQPSHLPNRASPADAGSRPGSTGPATPQPGSPKTLPATQKYASLANLSHAPQAGTVPASGSPPGHAFPHLLHPLDTDSLPASGSSGGDSAASEDHPADDHPAAHGEQMRPGFRKNKVPLPNLTRESSSLCLPDGLSDLQLPLQQTWAGSQPDSPEAAVLLASIGLRIPDPGELPGKRFYWPCANRQPQFIVEL